MGCGAGGGMDWWQVLYSFIGTFLGFGSTELTQRIYDKRKNQADKKRVRENIKDELISISEELRTCIDTENAICIATPVWDSVISTGMIMYFIEHEKDFYDEMLTVYNRISLQKKLEDSYQDDEKDYVKEFRKETSNRIDTCIGVIK